MAEFAVETALAKVNLTLHVTGLREDGYHLLQSLVVFPAIGDTLQAYEADRLSLSIVGPFADSLEGPADNLILRAARLFSHGKGAAITLEKNLPVASGIGGGSADAAATLRLLAHLWDLPLPGLNDALTLGADVPVCLNPGPTLLEGIGDKLTKMRAMPSCGILLVNPGLPVNTAEVFRTLECKTNSAMNPVPSKFESATDLANWLRDQRNDLQEGATRLVPEIGDVIQLLTRTDFCLLARMSGSGATCFGLFPTKVHAQMAAIKITLSNPDWWTAASDL